jgi:transposase
MASGFTGGYTVVKDDMRERDRRGREMFVPLAHPPGHAQADFGEATAIIGGVAQKAHVFVMAPAPRRLLCAGLSGGDCGGLGGRLEARGSAAI